MFYSLMRCVYKRTTDNDKSSNSQKIELDVWSHIHVVPIENGC